MRMRTLFGCLALGLLLTPSSVLGQSKAGMVSAVMEKSGIGVTIESIPGHFQRGLRQASQRNPLPPAAKEIIREVGGHAFSPERMREQMHARLLKRIPEERLVKVLEFLDSELGRKIVAMEKAAQSDQALRKALAQAEALQEKYRRENPERLQLAEAYLAATGVVESSTDIIINVQTAVFSGMAQALNPDKAPTLGQIRGQVEQGRFRIEGMMGHQQTAWFLYTYQEASNRELKAYLAFLETPAGQVYSRDMVRILGEVLVDETRNFARKVGSRLRDA